MNKLASSGKPASGKSATSIGHRIGTYVNYQRTKREMSVATLAKLSGLTASYISRLEQGDYESPTVEAVNKLAGAFGMPLVALLEKSDQEPQSKVELPKFAYYLHEKYFLPAEAIDDLELLLAMVQQKYRKKIERYKKTSDKYWQKHGRE